MADLIDRAALLKQLELLAKYEDPFRETVIRGVMFTISNVTAVDAVEVKHGHWQEYEDYCLDVYYDCSVCGGSFYMADGTPTENGYNFCPKCGTRMGETIRVELENDEID